ncbi:transposase [Streptomyces sp. BE308]|uniref:transposase n=1 Tax=Streptomyces sp. BE308 TaxID=3002529 RepID=UPI002E75E73F|nr:transposase [Streptomyces sp. BE308]MEE1791085.1 transposase [Streptomyces sp. BE308]
MSDTEWEVVRDAMRVPAWMNGRGGQPEGYCHRQMLDAVRYLVADGITWRAMPGDFPVWDRVYAFARRWGATGLLAELHDRLRGQVREDAGRDPQLTAPSSTHSRYGPPRTCRRPHGATTQARKCPAASATSWWTASAYCLPSW